jgi:hypothetical protein
MASMYFTVQSKILPLHKGKSPADLTSVPKNTTGCYVRVSNSAASNISQTQACASKASAIPSTAIIYIYIYIYIYTHTHTHTHTHARAIFIYCKRVSSRWRWSVNLYKNRWQPYTKRETIQKHRIHKLEYKNITESRVEQLGNNK